MHIFPLIRDLAIILFVAGVVSLIFQRIRQPVVLGYLLAGVILGPHTGPFLLIKDVPNIKIWAELGVIFLMFSLGLEFSFRKLARVGITASVTTLFEVLSMLSLGYLAGRICGWTFMDSLFLGTMLCISSTTIIIKALEELNLKTRRFAELIFGVLIVEDLVAILILVGLSTFAKSNHFSAASIALSAGKLCLVIGSWFLTGYFLIPPFMRYAGKIGNKETITILSIGLCLSLVVFADYFQYSAALGAFIMGSILAESSESEKIEALMQPLRHLFAAVFFVSVGMLLDPMLLLKHIVPVILITLITILGKILSTTFGALVTGQTLRTSIQVGFSLAQIGEFSFIIAGLGWNLGVVSEHLYPIGIAVSLVTTFTTPYLIRFSYNFGIFLERRLPSRVRKVLNRYAAWKQATRADLSQKRNFYQHCFRWALNGIIVSAVFLLIAELFIPSLESAVKDPTVAHWIGWLTALSTTAPFIWAMGVEFRKEKSPDSEKKGDLFQGFSLLISQLMTLLWVGLLSLRFIPAHFTVLGIFGIGIPLFIMFYRRLSTYYQWFESQFLSTFERKIPKRYLYSHAIQRSMAPWDAHLVRIKVHPNSKFVLMELGSTHLRSRYGINIVTVHRGIKTIIAPGKEEVLLPEDELLVLGSDEKIEKVRAQFETPIHLDDTLRCRFNYQLKQFKIESTSPLVGQSIHQSGIYEKFSIIVAGIERKHHRILNPESDLTFEAEDIAWIVGKEEEMENLKKYFFSHPSSAMTP